MQSKTQSGINACVTAKYEFVDATGKQIQL